MESEKNPPLWLQLWDLHSQLELVECNFGKVPKGSILSYQAAKPDIASGYPIEGPEKTLCVPPWSCVSRPPSFSCVQ